MLLALLLLVVLLGFSQPGFLTVSNFFNIMQTNAALLIAAIGLTFAILVGGFDLSVGGLLALSGVFAGVLIGAGVPAPLALLLIFVLGPVVGLVTNGFFIAYVRLNFFVVTIATDALFAGLALAIPGGRTQPLYDEPFIVALGTTRVAGIPLSVVVAILVLVLAGFVLRYTGFGRMVYGVGGNPEAARFAGINVAAVRAAAYSISAGLAVLGGLLMLGRIQSADPGVGQGVALQAAAAVLLGGTSFLGGEGGVLGTFLGVMFLGVLANGLTLAGISGFWQGVITGIVLLGAILIDRYRPGRQAAVGRGTS